MTRPNFSRLVPTTILGGVLAGLAALPVMAGPQPFRPSGTVLAPVHSDIQAAARTQVVDLPKGRSAVIDLPADAGDVFVSNPNVTDAVLRTPRRVFIMGVDAGVSDVLFFDGNGRQILNLSVRVDAATDELSDTVRRLFPNAHVDVQSLNGQVVLSGMAADDGQADQILRLAQSFADKPEHVINLMSIAGKDQVTLKVRIVEVNRSVIKQLGLASAVSYNFGTRSYAFGRANTYGVNGQYYGGTGTCYGQKGARTTDNSVTNSTTSGTNSSTGTSNQSSEVITTGNPPTTTTSSFTDPSGVTTTTSSTSSGDVTTQTIASAAAAGVTAASTLTNAATTAYSTITGTNSAGCLQSFERVGLARVLAEPNLTAVSGESAKFLAGGEFPVPVNQDNQGRITVEFKPYGVGLGFTPVVLSSGRISMRVSTEVSELSNANAFSLNNTFTIPALTVRRAESTVELQSGSSMMIAGLLQSKYKQTVDSLPGLTSLPILGALFRSRDFLSDETEMVVMVTPYLVRPGDPDGFQTPADNLQIASDAATVFMGRLNKVIRAPNGTINGAASASAAASAASAPYQAPVGYVIE
jgi:pilus assembly protein CpaC